MRWHFLVIGRTVAEVRLLQLLSKVAAVRHLVFVARVFGLSAKSIQLPTSVSEHVYEEEMLLE